MGREYYVFERHFFRILPGSGSLGEASFKEDAADKESF